MLFVLCSAGCSGVWNQLQCDDLQLAKVLCSVMPPCPLTAMR